MGYQTLPRKGVSGATRQRALSVLSSAMGYAVAEYDLPTNPCAKIQVRGYEDDFDPYVLSYDQLAEFFEAAKRVDAAYAQDAARDGRIYVPMRSAFEWAGRQGLRQGEVLGLSWSNVDLVRGEVHIAQQVQRRRMLTDEDKKNARDGRHLVIRRLKSRSSRRLLRISEKSLAALRELRRVHDRLDQEQPGWNQHGLLYPTVNGRPMDAAWFYWHWHEPIRREAGIKPRSTDGQELTFHSLRHTSITHQLAAGRPLARVAADAGHSSFKMTERYAHLYVAPESDAERRRLEQTLP